MLYSFPPEPASETASPEKAALAATGREQVWMSHGDEAIRLPTGFEAVATSEQVHTLAASDCCVARAHAVMDDDGRLWTRASGIRGPRQSAPSCALAAQTQLG